MSNKLLRQSPNRVFSLTNFTDPGHCTDKKEKKIFLIYSEIQSGAVAKSYINNGLLIYGELIVHFLIYYEALPHIYDFATVPL